MVSAEMGCHLHRCVYCGNSILGNVKLEAIAVILDLLSPAGQRLLAIKSRGVPQVPLQE